MTNDSAPPITTIDESQVNTLYVWKIAFIAAMGGLLFGYDFMVIGGVTIFYEAYFDLVGQPSLLGLSVASAPIGCILGAIFSMFFADRFGRKTLLIWAAVLFAISAAGTAFAMSFTVFNLFRLIGGLGIGLAANLSPMYIAEISPASHRGRVVTANQFTIMVGIVVSQVVNLVIERYGARMPIVEGALTWNQTIGWRLMFGAELIPALLFFGLMFTVPRSPRWLIKQGRTEEARQVLTKIGGEDYAAKEVADISSTISSEEVGRTNLRELAEPRLVKIILLGILLAVTQQWSGLNSVFAYSHQIFGDAGIGVSGTMISLVLQGCTMLIFCVVAMFVVDTVGRKKLMLLGALGISITHFLIGLSFHRNSTGIMVVALFLVAIALYATTLAPVMWVLLSELFPNRIRGVALGISVVALWTAYLILTYTFPLMRESMGTANTFWLYAAFLFVAFLVMAVALPETKGKTLEQIERDLFK
ncbi:MAG: sugar porter family MFS transporter [Phycisphaerales bacterium]|nr:sugar porter family MFS transporter [Phycisphaerales bacterium]